MPAQHVMGGRVPGETGEERPGADGVFPGSTKYVMDRRCPEVKVEEGPGVKFFISDLASPVIDSRPGCLGKRMRRDLNAIAPSTSSQPVYER